MRIFIFSVSVAAAFAAGFAFLLNSIQDTADVVFSTGAARVGGTATANAEVSKMSFLDGAFGALVGATIINHDRDRALNQ